MYLTLVWSFCEDTLVVQFLHLLGVYEKQFGFRLWLVFAKGTHEDTALDLFEATFPADVGVVAGG